MKIGIMQPYFFPYIGYWQLINAVDKFVVYDNIKFTKKSWIRRNRILLDGKDKMITIPIRNDSDLLDIRDRYISDDFDIECRKILNQIIISYRHAPEFDKVFPLIEAILAFESRNLFEFIYHSIIKVSEYLEIRTEIIVSSEIEMDHSLKCCNRVIETCKTLGGSNYINSIGGQELYDKADFQKQGIELGFLKPTPSVYKQYDYAFVPCLSIIDVMMFNNLNTLKEMLNEYSIV